MKYPQELFSYKIWHYQSLKDAVYDYVEKADLSKANRIQKENWG